MRFKSQAFSHAARETIDPARFVAQLHEIIDTVIDSTMDAGVDVIDKLPWSADEITQRVEAFVSRFVLPAERCAESKWDDLE